jgi:single-stranded-DNA-specific exonuclease
MVYDESYHEWIVGIVAGRLTDQYHKPSLVMYLNHDQGTASGSLRCPPYFNIVDMLHDPDIKPLLIRSGWHKQAGWLTVAINDIPILKTLLEKYVKRYVADIDTEKNIIVDTILTPDDITTNHLLDITKLAPFGEGNPEPTFLLPEAKIHNTSVVGKRGQWHLKCMVQYGSHKLTALYRSKGWLHGTLPDTVDIIAKIQSDSYSGGWSLIIDHIITK